MIKSIGRRLAEQLKLSFIGEIIKRFVLIYLVLGKRHRRFLIYLQIDSFINQFIITALLGSIAVLVALLSAPEIIQSNRHIHAVYLFLGLEEKEFLIFAAFAVSLMIAARAIYSLWSAWFSQKLTQSIYRVCVTQLYYYYVTREYTDFMSEKVDYITNVTHMVGGSINENIKFVALISLFINIIIVFLFLASYELLLTLILFFSILLFYTIILRRVKEKLRRYGQRSFAIRSKRLQLIHEGTAGTVDFLMSGKDRELGQFMDRNMREENIINLNTQLISLAPEHLIRVLGSLFIFFVILYFMYVEESYNYLISISVFLMGGIRLNLAINQLYQVVLSLSRLQHDFYVVIHDLKAAQNMRADIYHNEKLSPLHNYHSLQFNNVSYNYPQSSQPAVADINFVLPHGKVTILCGYSGSGKSTVACLMSGLLVPQKGEVLLDGQALRSDKMKRRWQLSIAYVTQKPFFISSSLAANIAFAYFDDDVIDYERLHQVVKQAEMEDFVNGLPDGLETQIGQNAMRLSGGEGQRILVARALYKKASLFIFDEATSALDKVTERKIINTILKTSQQRSVVIITHEPDIFDSSDQVIFLKQGKIRSMGTYQNLLQSSAEFRDFVGNPAPPT